MSTHIPIKAAAERLGVHENTIRNWIDRGILAAARLPTGIRRIAAKDVEKLELEMFGVPKHLSVQPMTHAPKPLGVSSEFGIESHPNL
jgi:excisionase family DNA binding protein